MDTALFYDGFFREVSRRTLAHDRRKEQDQKAEESARRTARRNLRLLKAKGIRAGKTVRAHGRTGTVININMDGMVRVDCFDKRVHPRDIVVLDS